MTYDFDTPIDRRFSDSVKWHRYADDVLPMWVADMDFRSPEPLILALRDRIEHGVFGYGTVPSELREVIVKRLQDRFNWTVEPDSLVFVPGVITGFNLVCHAVAAPGDGVLVQTPVYYPILHAPENARLIRDEAPLSRRPDGYYDIDFDRFESAITSRTRVFILCNPHNPVGRVFRRGELEQMAEICQRHDITICSDEIHCDLVYRGHRHFPIASLSPEIAERTITLMAPSKTFNVPGLKCSFAIIPNRTLREKFVSTHTGLVHGLNVLGYTAALAAYRDCQPWADEVVRYLESNADFLLEYAAEALPGLTVHKPEGTYLAWMDCRNAPIPASPYEFFLNKARVATNDGAMFGRGGDGFVRLNFACPRSVLKEALDRMRDALRDSSVD